MAASPTTGIPNGSHHDSHSPAKSPFHGWLHSLLPPVTSRSLLSHYLPASGALSHTLYTMHIFSPSVVHNFFPVGELAVSNAVLFNANLGLGFWLYFRPHVARADRWLRVEFSVFAATIFNFGSLLAAVLIKQILPKKTSVPVKSLVAGSLSLFLLSRAYRYARFVDRRRVAISSSKSPSPRLEGINGRHANGVHNTNGDLH